MGVGSTGHGLSASVTLPVLGGGLHPTASAEGYWVYRQGMTKTLKQNVLLVSTGIYKGLQRYTIHHGKGGSLGMTAKPLNVPEAASHVAFIGWPHGCFIHTSVASGGASIRGSFHGDDAMVTHLRVGRRVPPAARSAG